MFEIKTIVLALVTFSASVGLAQQRVQYQSGGDLGIEAEYFCAELLSDPHTAQYLSCSTCIHQMCNGIYTTDFGGNPIIDSPRRAECIATGMALCPIENPFMGTPPAVKPLFNIVK